jgi:hypothetical protein
MCFDPAMGNGWQMPWKVACAAGEWRRPTGRSQVYAVPPLQRTGPDLRRRRSGPVAMRGDSPHIPPNGAEARRHGRQHHDVTRSGRQRLRAHVASRDVGVSVSTGDQKCADPECDDDCTKRHPDTRRAYPRRSQKNTTTISRRWLSRNDSSPGSTISSASCGDRKRRSRLIRSGCDTCASTLDFSSRFHVASSLARRSIVSWVPLDLRQGSDACHQTGPTGHEQRGVTSPTLESRPAALGLPKHGSG